MTSKKLKLRNSKDIKELKRGTMLKRNGDLFIVAEVARPYQHSSLDRAPFGGSEIQKALYGEGNITTATTHDITTHGHGSTAGYSISTRRESEYTLISLATGSSFYGSIHKLNDLLVKIINTGGFEVVQSIEITEV